MTSLCAVLISLSINVTDQLNKHTVLSSGCAKGDRCNKIETVTLRTVYRTVGRLKAGKLETGRADRDTSIKWLRRLGARESDGAVYIP